METYNVWYEGKYSIHGESHSIPSLANDVITTSNDETAREIAEENSKNFYKQLFDQIKGQHSDTKIGDLEFEVVIQSLKKDISLKE